MSSSSSSSSSSSLIQRHHEIIFAALRGLIFWLGLYVILVHVMVAWHWDSGIPYGMSEQQELSQGITTTTIGNNDNDNNHQIVENEDEDVIVYYVDHPTTQYKDTVLKLVEDLKLAHHHQEWVLTRLAEENTKLQQISTMMIQQLQPTIMNDWSSLITTTTTSSSSSSSSSQIMTVQELQDNMMDLEMLLSTPSLESLDGSVLESTFTQVMNHIRNLLLLSSQDQEEEEKKGRTSVDWEQHIHSILSGTYPSKEPSIAKENCPSDEEQEDADSSAITTTQQDDVEIDPNVAITSDVIPRLQKFQRYFDRRQDGAALAASMLPDSMIELEHFITTEITKSTFRLVQRQHKQLDAMCINTEQVMDMVHAGLTALYMHNDIRDVLKQKVLEKDDSPFAKQLILDAPLPLSSHIRPPPSSTTSSSSPTTNNMNVRQLLNSELITHQAVEWIDEVVSLMEGHDDRIDSFIDSLTTSGGSGNDSSSPGELFMTSLLKHAGKVNLPRPQTLIETMESSPYYQEIKRFLQTTVS